MGGDEIAMRPSGEACGGTVSSQAGDRGVEADGRAATACSVLPLDERVEELLGRVASANGEGVECELLHDVRETIGNLRDALRARQAEADALSRQAERQARAQADAIVLSAEIIEELEETKQHLSIARAAAEQSARETRVLADKIFEGTHDGVLVFENAVCVACNDNARQLLGVPREAILGRWPVLFEMAEDIAGEPARELLHAAYRRAGKRERVEPFELRLTAAGGPFWAEISMSGFSMNTTTRVLVLIRDVTSRRQLQEQLTRHRNFLDGIINAVPDQISVQAMDGRLVAVNDAFCRAVAKRRPEILGRQAAWLVPEPLREQVQLIENRLLASGRAQTAEHEVEGPSGERCILSVKRTLFDDEAGDHYVIATARDITEDRVREERLRLLASVFKSATEGVGILDAAGTVCEANPALLRMLTTHGELIPIGQSLTAALDLQIQDFSSALRRVIGGSPWSGKATKRQPDGAPRSYWVSLSPSSEASGASDRIITLVSDITEVEATQAKLRRQALFDDLTGLPNRRLFRETLQRRIEAASGPSERDVPGQEPVPGIVICLIDLDDFKHVNDADGHSAGDQLLQQVGARIQQVAGSEAFVARFGGDEFALILTDEQPVTPRLDGVLERLLECFRLPFSLANSEPTVGMSLGVTRYPADGHDVETLMANADIAMYAAKAAGKNQIRHYSPEMQTSVDVRHQLQTKLRRALADGEITLRFQPKVDARTFEPAGCEALARWCTGTGQSIPPGDFIPVAEQTGLIVALGAAVFRRAAQQATLWHADGRLPAVAVNVSPSQMRHPTFIPSLMDALAQTGARAEWFELEITEHAMMDDVGHAIQMIDRLAELGFRVAIDDFGTGYSSLSYLKNFRIHTLKIDLSLVRDVTHDSQSAAIVRSVVSLGTGLGLGVVAEGVETARQAEFLADCGCTTLQGYYFGRPMLATEYAAWLDERRSPSPTETR